MAALALLMIVAGIALAVYGFILIEKSKTKEKSLWKT